MYMHTHIYMHMKQFWFVCSMCQTYWAHVFLIGCARHIVNGMQPAWLNRTTSHLVPHLGGVAASVGAFNRADVYTLGHACASAL